MAISAGYRILIGALVVGLCGQADAMSRAERGQIDAALSKISTASGESAKDRMRSCGIRIRPESYIEVAATDIPTISAKRGDTIMELEVDLPKPPDFDPTTDSDQEYLEMLMRWTIHSGKAFPTSGWAQALQKRPIPLASSVYMNC